MYIHFYLCSVLVLVTICIIMIYCATTKSLIPLNACRSAILHLKMWCHYGDIIMRATASHITSFTIVRSTIYSGAHERRYKSSTSLAFVRGIHRWPVNSPHKGPVTRKIFLYVNVIINVVNDELQWFSLAIGMYRVSQWIALTIIQQCGVLLFLLPCSLEMLQQRVTKSKVTGDFRRHAAQMTSL